MLFLPVPRSVVSDPRSPARPEDALEAAENALRNWQTCYPEDVFVPPTDAQVKAASDLLRANGFTPDALYAEWGRHIVRCLAEPLAPALAALAVLLAERDEREQWIEAIGAIACDLLTALQPWDFHTQAVRSAAVRLTVALAAVPESAAGGVR